MPSKHPEHRQGAAKFPGFAPLSANYVYCPNQFLDVCLPNCSRGVVRIVAYVLRETLGWLDRQGNPLREEIEVSYSDLIKKANVSRGSIGKALQEAVDRGFLVCRRQGIANSSGSNGQSAVFLLRWDTTGDYTCDPERFTGFFAGEGHRTPVPNRFFDDVVRNESLSVTKVVGAVIRHTVGYQNQFGGRRTSCPLSYRQIQQYTNLSDRSTLAQALRHAQDVGYIDCLEPGEFATDPLQRKAATYAIRWLQKDKFGQDGSKTRPENERSKKQTSSGLESRPKKQFKNQTTKKQHQENDIEKQQCAAGIQEAVTLLMTAGLNEATARQLAEKQGLKVVQNQIAWLEARNPENRVAMLRRAIEENWEKPASIESKEKIEASRKRHASADARRLLEDKAVAEAKQIRNRRKQRLVQEWKSAPVELRRQWIQLAVKREPSATIAELIRRERADSENPRVQVLDAIAIYCNLPTVMQTADVAREQQRHEAVA